MKSFHRKVEWWCWIDLVIQVHLITLVVRWPPAIKSLQLNYKVMVVTIWYYHLCVPFPVKTQKLSKSNANWYFLLISEFLRSCTERTLWQERDSMASLPEWVAYHSGVDLSLYRTSQAPPSALPWPWELSSIWRNRTSSWPASSVSQNAERHHPREDLFSRFLDFQVLGGQVPLFGILAYKDVAADSVPHGLSGVLHSQRQNQDTFPPVVGEVALGSLNK